MNNMLIADPRYFAHASELEELYQRGYDFWNEARFELATTCFMEIALRNPLERRYIFACACAMKQQHEIHHALKLFMQAVVMQADEPWAYFHIGDCLQMLGEIIPACEALEVAIKLCDGQAHDGALLQQSNRLMVALRGEY